MATATFVRRNTWNKGTWKGVFGQDGYIIAAHATSLPSYLSGWSINGASTWTTRAGSTLLCDLVKTGATTDRIATQWYTGGGNLDFDFTLSQAARVAIYCTDQNNVNRRQTFQVQDAGNSYAVLATHALDIDFSKGAWVLFDLSAGSFRIHVVKNAGDNASVDGLFWSDDADLGAAAATYLGEDDTTQGTWKGVYGADGYHVAGYTSSYPAGVVHDDYFTPVYTSVTDPTTNLAGTQKPAPSTERTGKYWYTGNAGDTNFLIPLVLPTERRVSVYAHYFEAGVRRQTVEVLETDTGTVLDTQTLADYLNGKWLSWNLSGAITLRLTKLDLNSAVAAALMFDVANQPPTAPTITSPGEGGTVGETFTLAVTSGADPDPGDVLTDYYRTTLDGGTPSAWAVINGTASVTSAPGSLLIEAKTNDGTVDGPTDSVTVTVVAAPAGPTVTDVDVHFNFATIIGSAYSGDMAQGGRRFRVYESDGVTLAWDSLWVSPPVTTYPDAPLAPLTDYFATVQDKDELGQETAESAQFPFTTGDYPDVQVTQAGLAVLVADAAPEARVTQVVAEVATQKAGLAEARVTQVYLETLLPHESLVYTGYPCCLLLEHYKLDGVTVDWSVTTAPFLPNSYLRDPVQDGSGYAAQECDFLEGRASIGSVKVCVIDAAFPGGDQQDRWLTNKLATSGQGAIRGHRERLRRFISPALGWVTVADGPAGSPRLRPSYAGYEWDIRDTRERERGLKAFSGRANLSIMPRGPIANWGDKGDGTYLLSAVTPLTGVYHQAGWLDFSAYLTPSDWTNSSAVADDRIIITDAVRKAGEITSSTFVGPTTADYQHEYANLQIWWRVPPATDWNLQTDLSVVGVGLNFFEYASGTYKDDDGNTVSAAAHLLTLRRFGIAADGTSFATEPGEGASVEVLIVYTGPVSEDFPLYLETTDGALLKDCYDGDYTPDINGDPTPTGILYDSAALARLTHPVLARITEPADNLREWTEKNIYAAVGYVPAFDNYLRISPASQEQPADTSGLTDLTNAITAPQPTWQHGDKIVNVLRFKYRRFYPDPTGDAADGIAVREITQEFRNEDSIALHGEQELEIDTEAFGAVGGTAGEALGSEEGNILAQARHTILFPRYLDGTPTATLKCFRSATYALRPGSFVKLSPSWMPEYATGLRGMASIGQVLEARDLNCAWREFTVEVVPQTHSGSFALGGGGGLSFTTTQG